MTAPAKGTATKLTDPGMIALFIASQNGAIQRGGHEGEASVTLINSLARRGWLERTIVMRGARPVVTGAVITEAGRKTLARALGV